ncbi:MAG TPA: methyltransferase domain-containing protein [Burkholderiales bacterium]|jgi:hypothetical protein|nr:methyltransferase domain-containing protein [Burkholderiales bacterium]
MQKSDRDAYVQYGCGFCAPATWRNFDASPTLRFERIPIIGSLYSRNASRFPDNVEYGDIVRGLPVADGSCRAIYCSHVLEHLSLDEFRRALRNTHALLQDGAIFRLVMPDFEECVKAYTSSQDAEAAIRFMSSSGLGTDARPRSLGSMLSALLGRARHHWLWDFKAARLELERSGFSEVRRARYGDSFEARFADVEEEARWANCLGIECQK